MRVALPTLIAVTPMLMVPAEAAAPEHDGGTSGVLAEREPLAFDSERAEPCLAEARRVMEEYDQAYHRMEGFYVSGEDYHELRKQVMCQKTYPASVARQRGIPSEVFMKFEGGWRGKWSGIEAADGTRRYRIDEQIPGQPEVRGVEASYQTWKTDLDRQDLHDGIRALTSD